MGTPGIGVMIGWLGGNESTVEALKASYGQRIEALACNSDELSFALADGATLRVRDDGQSCCESRYMTCDDDLKPFVGATLAGMEVRDGPSTEESGEPHDVQFLIVTTSQGAFTVATHVEHNGYYGGFWLVADYTAAAPAVQP